MVIAYWLIGREIVEEIQGGEERAEYGKRVVEELSEKLTKRYIRGFSTTNLWYFKQFYLAFFDKNKILHIQDGESEKFSPILHNRSGELEIPQFYRRLTWSHYRVLMKVVKKDARDFYEKEAEECTWDVEALERHIHSQYYERLLRSQNPQEILESTRREISKNVSVSETLKNPYVLEFLGVPHTSVICESQLEQAIITHLQEFLLELGRGFAFVARQKRMRFDETDLFVDLVFYNCILKCYLLIDLKMGELSYQDVGQMDGYVRMFDDIYKAKDDNPTIGLILCTERNEAVAKYSVLNDGKQIFASKYMLFLPTEDELKIEIERERNLIESRIKQDLAK